MRRILLLVRYDGTEFHGWQTQHELRTVQETVTTAMNRLTGETTTLHASSRTDAGVHARGLPVLTETTSTIPIDGLRRGLNSILADDLAVVAVADVEASFHVRGSASSKVYRYHIWNSRTRSPLHARMSWHVPVSLDVDAMKQAAAALVGEHDFSSFRASSCQSSSTIRRIDRITIEHGPDKLLHIIVEGNAFLQHMVRIIVGTLVEVGRGFRPPEWVHEVVMARDRRQGGPTSPARGLYLWQVVYDPCPFDVSDINP